MLTNNIPDSRPDARSEFFDGVRLGMPIIIATLPFGLLFGALATQNGMSIGEAVLMSALIFGGASQMVGLDLFGQEIAPWLIVLSIFAVNFRHVLYSAALGRKLQHWTPWQRMLGFFFLTDAQYAEGEKRNRTVGMTFSWYMGLGVAIYVFWIVTTVVGAVFGNLIPNPHAIGMDFFLPIYFLGMVMDFRSRPLWLPVVGTSAVVSVAAFHFVGSPWHVSIGAAAGVALAAILTPTRAG